jgi:hypothetical protein
VSRAGTGALACLAALAASFSAASCGPTRTTGAGSPHAASPAVVSPTDPTAVVFHDPAGRRPPDARTPGADRPTAVRFGADSPVALSAPASAAQAPPADPLAALAEAALGLVPVPAALVARPGEPSATPATDETAWWLATPEPVPGRVRLVAHARAGTLAEARTASVEAARRSFASLGHRGNDPTIERTRAEREPDGSFRAFVLASLPDRPE